MISPGGVQFEQAASEPQQQQQQQPQVSNKRACLGAQADSEPTSSTTRFRASSAALASTSSSAAQTARKPAAAAAAAPDKCGRVGWCVVQQTGATSSMPPADPSRVGNHVADTGLMLRGQQPQQPTSLQLASPERTAADLPDAAHPPQSGAAAEDAGKLRHQQAVGTDSEDDSWSPGQPQSSEDAAGAAAASADDGSDEDMMAAAAYDDSDVVDDEAAWGAHMPPPVYCTNCTARLYVSDCCSDCGHSKEQDSELLSCTAASADATEEAAAEQDCPIIIWDDSMLLHEEGKLEPHPERPDRLRAVVAQLKGNGLTGLCQRVPARLATKEELLRVHTPDHLHRLQLFCSGQVPPSAIPSDTYINQHTLQCAALAAGSAAEVAVRVFEGEGPCGAAIIRPPGHHAESNTAMGFCFFNNAAVAARAVQDAGAERVLILDWDVHHGNGTQHIFEHDDSVLYMSLHRYDRGTFYPGTGAASEVGQGAGEGFTVNVPWDTDAVSDGDYMAAMQQVLLPIAREFAPDMILISAGFDAAAGDPIGGCNLTPDCFAAMTAALMPIAPTVLLLEGGYNLRSTALSTEACLRVLLGEPGPAALSSTPSPYAWFSIQATRKAHSRYWKCLAGGLAPLHLQLPGWRFAAGAAAAAAAGPSAGDDAADMQQQQQQQQGLTDGDDLELQYDDEYEEAEYESDGNEGEQDWEDGVDGDAGGAGDGGDVDMANAAVAGEAPTTAVADQQHRMLAGHDASAARRLGSKRGPEGIGDAGGDDDARRRIKPAAGAEADAQHDLHCAQHSGSGSAVQRLARNGSGVSSSSAASGGNHRSSGGSSSHSSRRRLSRKQLMLQAIHNRAMQCFLRKQRKVAAAHKLQQQQQGRGKSPG